MRRLEYNEKKTKKNEIQIIAKKIFLQRNRNNIRVLCIENERK